MNTKTFKRIITIVELVLIGIIFLCFAGTCLNIDPIKGLDLDNMKYDGYHAFFGYGSEFDTSVGSVTIAILLGIVGVLGIVSMIFPKISVIFNSIIAILAIFAGVFIFLGTTEFMVVRYSQSIEYFDYYCEVYLGYGAILAGISAFLIACGAIAQEIYAFIKR